MDEDFAKAIADIEGVLELKDEIQNCFGVNYDFAAHQIVHIKKHHNPDNWEFQTIEPGILVQNLVSNGVSQENAENFYAGLCLNSQNKLPIKDSVYKVNSMERYFFRPILEISQNKKIRQLIGIQKWAESITVLATNNFQWNKAPEEWKRNNCFQQYLEKKSNAHDALLEDEVEKILKENGIPFFRNVTSFSDGSSAISINNLPGVGEIDFIWLDNKRQKIIVADCKYNRARYDMIAFSADYSNFKDSYEKKIRGKVQWVSENRDLVYKHFKRYYPDLNAKMKDPINELFIINTPTLYMYLGRVNTVCFLNLNEFMKNGYKHPDLVLRIKNRFKVTIKLKSYPYL